MPDDRLINPSHKKGLRKKLVWATLLVGALPVILGLGLTYSKGNRELRGAIGANFEGLAREAAEKVDLVIAHEIEEVSRLAASAEIVEAVRRSNRNYLGRSPGQIREAIRRDERRWEAQQRNPGQAGSLLSNRASQVLVKTMASREEQTVHIALFAADEKGALVASNNAFPPFLLADSAAWQKTFLEGRGDVSLGEIYRDTEGRRFLFDLGVPIIDPTSGRAVGALILVSDVKELFRSSIFPIRFGETGHAMLMDGDGNVLICPILPTGMHMNDARLVQAISGDGAHYSVVPNDGHGGSDSIVGSAPVFRVNQILARSDSAPWFSFIRQDPKELKAPIRSLMKYTAGASVTLLGLLAFLAFWVSNRLVRPVRILHEGAEVIGKGNLSHRLNIKTHDELEQLADEFNRMAENLQDSYAGLERRVADRTKELMALNTIALTVNRSLELQETLDATLEKVLEVMQSEAGGIWIWDETRGRLFLRASRGFSTPLVRQSEELLAGEDIPGIVAAEQGPLVVDERNRGEFSSSAIVRAGFSSVVCIPVQSHNRPVAVLAVADRVPRTVTQAQLQLIASIGNQMGTAIENATLYAGERTMVARLKEIDRLKSEFLSNVSHELRMPLTSIIGFSELLLDRIPGELTADQEEYLQNIQGSGQHLLEIINNLLNLSKLRAGKMEIQMSRFAPEDLIEAVRRTVLPLAAKKGLTLTATPAPGLAPALSDEGKIRQILLNLLGNAVKFTPAGGSIQIRGGPTVMNGRPAVEISVEDNGIGVRPEDRERIFEEFQQVDSSFTRDFSGTGLGLTISRQFAGLLGGQLRLESHFGQGSTFTLIFPLEAPQGASAPAPAQPPSPSSKEIPATSEALAEPENQSTASGTGIPALPTILVVEDDPAVARLLSLYLTQEGYHVEYARDGEEAVEMARNLRPFAITLDIMLPRKDGWEVLQSLKQLPETRAIPVLIVSIIDNRELGFSLGATDYFTKPIDRTALLNSLKGLNLTGRARRKPVNILVIDDDPQIHQMIRVLLSSEGFGVIPARRASEGIDLAIEIQPDLILLDLLMPDLDGFEALERLKEHPTAKNIPVIVFTARNLSRSDRNRLTSKIRGVIQKGGSLRETLLTEIRKFEKLYPDKARMVDGLTGLYNERYLHNRLADEVERARRIRRPFSLLLVNLDGFQAFNQEFGLEEGNGVLRQTAEILRRNTRSANPLCRCGGTTFAVILTETLKAQAELVGEKMRKTVRSHPFPVQEPDPSEPHPRHFTLSVGVATFFEDGETGDELLSQAHRALEEARRRGGDTVVVNKGLLAAGESDEGTG